MLIESKIDERKELVKKMAAFLEEEPSYLGAPSFSYKIGVYIIHRSGTIEVSDDDVDMDQLRQMCSVGIIKDVLRDGEAIQISVPIADHTVNTLQNLLHLFSSKEAYINKAIGCSYNFLMDKRFIKSIDNNEPKDLEEFFMRLKKAGGENANRGLIFTEDKITFSFPYTIDADRIQAYTNLVSKMNEMALTHKRISKECRKTSNEKYAFRNWIVRLGLNGEEYKTTRAILLKNIPGIASYKTKKQLEVASEKLKQMRKENRKCLEFLPLN